MKRKWWVIVLAAGVGATLYFILEKDGRIIHEHSFGRAGIVGIAPDGRVAVFGTNGLAFIEEHGEVQSVPVSGAAVWGGWSVSLRGTNGLIIYEMIPGGGGSIRALDWEGNEQWIFRTNALIGLPASDAAGNVSFFGPNWEVRSFAPTGELRWTYFYQAAAPGFQLRSHSPMVSPEGRVAVMGDRLSGLAMLDSEGVEQWRLTAVAGGLLETGGSFAPNGDLLARVGWELWRIDPAGQVIWRLDLADFVDDRGTVAHGMLTPIFGPDGAVYCPIGKWVFAISANGQLQWQFRHDGGAGDKNSTVMGMGQSWGCFNASGDLIVLAGDWESVNTTGAGGAMTLFQLVDNERLVCLGSDGAVKWEQAFPSSAVWSVPRNRVDLTMLWKSRMGMRASKYVSNPTLAPDGTVYVSGWANGKTRIWAIRGD